MNTNLKIISFFAILLTPCLLMPGLKEEQMLLMKNNKKLWQAIENNKYNTKEEFKTITKALNDGARINDLRNPNNPERNLLDYALEIDNLVLFYYLLEKNIFIDKKDAEGNRPAHWVLLSKLKEQRKYAYMNVLKKFGADFTIKNNHDETPLVTAIKTGDKKIVKLLLREEINLKRLKKIAHNCDDKDIATMIKTRLHKLKIHFDHQEEEKLTKDIMIALRSKSPCSDILLKFKPSENHYCPYFLIDLLKFEILGSYMNIDENTMYYTLQSFNPLDKNFKKIIIIAEKEYKIKNEIIDKLWYAVDEAGRFLKDTTKYPNSTYRIGNMCYKQGYAFTNLTSNKGLAFTGPNEENNYLLPDNNDHKTLCEQARVTFINDQESFFKRMEKDYQQQQLLFARIYEKTKLGNLNTLHDINFNYCSNTF